MFGFIKPRTLSHSLLSAGILFLLIIHAPASRAALTVGATRIVFDSEKRSTAVIVSNPSNRTFAVQTWVNTETDDATTAVPFIASPPLFRLDPAREQQVQINGLPNNMPRDRESLFYFNVQEIPQVQDSEGNVLNVALRTRLKFFYRPAELKDNPASRLKDLEWSLTHTGGKPHLTVTNPTPFHVSFARLEVTDGGRKEKLQNAAMVGPFMSRSYPLANLKASPGLRVMFTAINDYGGQTRPLDSPIQINP
ncbi:MAG TPA: molecular chaperone [Pseudomonas sp.]|jgi:chaperone protein EcpD